MKDSCAFDGYVNSIYTIAVASITKDGKVTGFSEACSSIMTAVYSTKMVSIVLLIARERDSLQEVYEAREC